jgi:hypothetical protein
MQKLSMRDKIIIFSVGLPLSGTPSGIAEHELKDGVFFEELGDDCSLSHS